MSSEGYFDVDRYGVPGRMLNLSDAFYGAPGRVAALGALVELRMSDIVVLWGRETSDTGVFMQHLTDRFREIKKSRLDVVQDIPEGLIQAVADAKSVMKERNELLHGLWPGEDIGWRNRRALNAHDHGSNKGRGILSDDYRVDAWFKGDGQDSRAADKFMVTSTVACSGRSARSG